MNLQQLFQFQMSVDILLLVTVLGLFWYLRRALRQQQDRGTRAQEEIAELRRLLDESRSSSTEFLEALEEGRKTLKALSLSLEDRERRLREILKKSEGLAAGNAGLGTGTRDAVQDRYREALRLAGEGRSDQEIADVLGMMTGEVQLLLNLRDNAKPNRL